MFDVSVKGIGDFTNKIKDFSTSTQFEELSSGISKLGSSIYNGFSFILDHPELAGDVLKLGVALFAIGKIGALVSAITSIGALFGTGGLLAGAGAVIAPILPGLALLVGGLLTLSSVLSPGGMLNKAIGALLGKAFGSDTQKAWEEQTNSVGQVFSHAKDGLMMLFNLEKPEDVINKNNNNIDASKLTYYDKNGVASDNGW